MITVAELSHAQKRLGHARLGAVAVCASLSSVWIRYEWIAKIRYHEVGASRRERGNAVRWTRPHASRRKSSASSTRALLVITASSDSRTRTYLGPQPGRFSLCYSSHSSHLAMYLVQKSRCGCVHDLPSDCGVVPATRRLAPLPAAVQTM